MHWEIKYNPKILLSFYIFLNIVLPWRKKKTKFDNGWRAIRNSGLETCIQQVVYCFQSKRIDSLISWKREKIALVSWMSHISLPTGIFCLPISQGQTIAHWQTDSAAWQTSRLIHPRTKAGQYFVCGIWRSSATAWHSDPAPHSWWVHIWMHGQAAHPVLGELRWTPSVSKGILSGFPSVVSEQRAKNKAGREIKQSQHQKFCLPLVRFGQPSLRIVWMCNSTLFSRSFRRCQRGMWRWKNPYMSVFSMSP